MSRDIIYYFYKKIDIFIFIYLLSDLLRLINMRKKLEIR